MKSQPKTTIDRLLEFMEFKGLNDNKITKLAGLSVGLIGRARRNKSGLHTDTIEKILNTFKELNPTWLLTGIGDMILPSFEKTDNTLPTNNEESLIDEIFSTQREVIALLKKQYFKSDI
ncbi:hypothetical protein O2K51_01505 [Apibacter raozihei]|uniref:hypothetical protein n=1 Tax=Apibacter TaxID=1778601 RepID=UPI000FE2F4C6|nr:MULTISPECIES: hypothetical protein [Apibacter]